MTKKEIASKIAKQFDITQLLALEAVQMVFDGIIETLMDEGRIELLNFGVFEVKRRKPRKARNLAPERVWPYQRGWSSPSSLDWRWSNEPTNGREAAVTNREWSHTLND